MLDKFLAEFIGTFIFLGVIIVTVDGVSLTIADKSQAWIRIGLALGVAILFMGKISGGHFNPAVSFMFFLNNELKMNELFVYIVAQLLGAVLAMISYKYLYVISNKK